MHPSLLNHQPCHVIQLHMVRWSVRNLYWWRRTIKRPLGGSPSIKYRRRRRDYEQLTWTECPGLVSSLRGQLLRPSFQSNWMAYHKINFRIYVAFPTMRAVVLGYHSTTRNRHLSTLKRARNICYFYSLHSVSAVQLQMANAHDTPPLVVN